MSEPVTFKVKDLVEILLEYDQEAFLDFEGAPYGYYLTFKSVVDYKHLPAHSISIILE